MHASLLPVVAQLLASISSDDDIVSELTPLVGDSSEFAQERPLTRNLSDNSLSTVVPLAGMLIRSHVISATIDNRYGGQVSNVRPSSTKAVSAKSHETLKQSHTDTVRMTSSCRGVSSFSCVEDETDPT